ncbi:hypothetical protein C8R47DRAFT_1143081 [Mycena vitilis]|nr:hypothetical protein C8R47DRAFT_1143081 [Mycena vitilis]
MVWIAVAGLPDLLMRRRGSATLWMPLPLRRGSFIAPGPSLSPLFPTMQPRALSQITSVSRAAGNIPTLSVAPTTVFVPASVPPTPATVQLPPTTVIVTSILAPAPNPPATTSTPAPVIPTAVFTTVTHVFTTTTPGTSPVTLPAFTTSTTPRDITTSSTTLVGTDLVGTSGAVYGPPKSGTLSRSSAARSSASASALPTYSPSPHKPKSNVGKYVGYAIGAVFFLTLISSFFSAYRKHRKYVRKRPRGSIFNGGLSGGQSSPQKRSMAQALMRSVSNTSFDAYALSNSPPTSPAPVFLNGSRQLHLDRSRGFTPSPNPTIRPLPPTPTKYTHDDDAVFFPHVPPAVDVHDYSPRDYSPFGIASHVGTRG